MRRLPILGLLVLAALASPAAAQTTDVTDSCMDQGVTAAAAGSADGGTTVTPLGGDDGSTGGTPVSWDGGSTGAEPVQDPAAVLAQEPEPEPEGPGEEQPGEPGEPPAPEQPGGEAPGGEAPGGETGGGLPRTGIEALQLAFLGVVLLLVGARLRVLALRRRRGEQTLKGSDPLRVEPEPEPVPEPGVWHEPAQATSEWRFPDPNEPAPTGLLPSTAGARRRARELVAAGEPD